MYLRRRGAEGEDGVREQVQREEGSNWADVKPASKRSRFSVKKAAIGLMSSLHPKGAALRLASLVYMKLGHSTP